MLRMPCWSKLLREVYVCCCEWYSGLTLVPGKLGSTILGDNGPLLPLPGTGLPTGNGDPREPPSVGTGGATEVLVKAYGMLLPSRLSLVPLASDIVRERCLRPFPKRVAILHFARPT